MAKTTAKTAKQKKPFRIFSLINGFDMPFFVILMLILAIGLISLFSASYAYAYTHNGGDSYFYIRKQLLFALAGILIMLIVSTVDYHVLHHLAVPVMVVSYILLVVVLMLPASNGIHRWIRIPGMPQFQPSEVAKFGLILLFAHLISHNHKRMHTFLGGYLPFMLILGSACGLVFVEPHLSGTILLLAIGMVLMFVGGTRLLFLIVTLIVGIVAVVYMVYGLGYELDRIQVWLDPMGVYKINRDQAWQTVQSLYAIGSGGLMGVGLGNSRQKHSFLPEPQNDFIFSVICEELGFIGALIIVILFALLVWRGFTIAMKAPDKFGAMLAIGLTAQIGLQAMMNLAVVTNTIPNTGISLPFFSYGGTSLIMLLAQMGVVLSISRHSKNRSAT